MPTIWLIGIADEAEQRERDQRHREHHDDGLQQAANDEGEHLAELVRAGTERRGNRRADLPRSLRARRVSPS